MDNQDPKPVTNRKTDRIKAKHNRRKGGDRRKDWGILAYYMAGGLEQRDHEDRRRTDTPLEQRSRRDRRKVVNPEFLNCGKIMDTRKRGRRASDRVDPVAVEKEASERLGPGWL